MIQTAFTRENMEVEANTFSIVAADLETGELGVAVATKLPAVGVYVPFVEAGVGAVASQAIVNPAYGPRCLELLQNGMPPEDVIRQITAEDKRSEDRQLSVINAKGKAASFTGAKNSKSCGHRVGENYAVAGNLLANTETLDAMAKAFEETKGRLSDRMLAAMAAGEAAGGDSRGKQSAAILIKKPGAYFNEKYVDLRVDDHEEPIVELQRVHKVYMASFLHLPGYRSLDVGDQGIDVRRLNRWLAEAGYGDAKALEDSGDRYTDATLKALRNATNGSGESAPELTPLRAWELQKEAEKARTENKE